MARFRSTFSRSMHSREKKSFVHFPLFLVRKLLTMWVSSTFTFVVSTERCVEHAKGLFKLRPYFVLSCCIVVYHTLYFYSILSQNLVSHLKTTSEESVIVRNLRSEPFPLKPTPSSFPPRNIVSTTSGISLHSPVSPFHTGMTATYLPF